MTEESIHLSKQIGYAVPMIGKGVRIAPTSVVHDGVVIGEGSVIEDFCIIGKPVKGAPPLVLGPRSIVRSHSVIYRGSTFGAGLETGHHVLIRDGVRCGRNLRVGSFSAIEGDCSIGDYCRFHGYVHVGRGSRIGHFVWVYSLSVLTNDPLPPSALRRGVTVRDGAVVAVGCVLMPGITVGRGAFVATGSCVRENVPDSAVHNPGRPAMPVTELFDLRSGLRHPWMGHYGESCPPEARGKLARLREGVLRDAKTMRPWKRRKPA